MSKEATRFKQTGIGELPEGWEVKKLSEIAIIKQGGKLGLTKKDYVSEGYPAFSATGQDGFVSVYEYEGEAIILSSIGAQCGKCFYATGKWTTLANTQIIFVNPKIANTLFIFYQVNRPNFWIRSGSAQPFIHPSDVKNAKVIIPPLEEQRRIAGVLRLVDRVAEETKRIINIYERAKKFALKHLLTRGIGHTRFKHTEIGKLPEEWEVVRLGDVATLEMEQIPVSALPEDTLYVGMEHIESNTGRLITDKLPTVRNIKGLVFQFTPDHILYGKLRPYLNKVWKPHFSGVCSTELVPIRCDEKQIDGNYLKFWLLSPMFVVYAKKFSEGTRMPRVNLKALINAPIPLPSLEEQKQIAEMLSTIDAAIENERKYLGVLEKCKKWMLDNLLTGKVRLPPEVDEILKGVLPDAF